MGHSLITVWWCDEWRSWGVTCYDDLGNQVEESDWYAYKSDAVHRAKSLQKENVASEVTIRTKKGK